MKAYKIESTKNIIAQMETYTTLYETWNDGKVKKYTIKKDKIIDA